MQPHESTTTEPAEATEPPAGATTRRRVLRFAGAGFAAAATAGCVETLPPLGQRVRYGRVDVPEPASGVSDPVYRRWLPAASALPDGLVGETDAGEGDAGEGDAGEEPLDPGWVNYVEPETTGRDFDGDGRANRLAHTYQVPHLDHFGVGYANFDRVANLHDFGTTFVIEGEFDPGAVGATLADSGYAAAGDHAGYDVFDRDGGRRTAAVGDGAIVWANHGRSRAIVEAVVDAGRGAVPRHHEESETFAFATDRIGARAWTWVEGLGFPHDVGQVVESRSTTVTGDAIYTVLHLVFPAGEPVPDQEIRDALEETERATGALAVDLQVDDRVATVEMRRTHQSVDDPYEGVAIPQVTWGATLDGEGASRAGDEAAGNADAVTIRHEAGDPVAAERLTFAFEDPAVEDRDERITETDRQFADVTDTVRPGDAITVSAPGDLSGKSLLGRFSPPDSAAASVFVVTKFP